MSKEEVVAVLARHNPNSRSSFEKRIKVNSHGDFFIDKLIMDAFIFYSSETLFVPRRSASSCNFSECSRAAEYGFDGMKSSLCAEHKLKGMRVKGNILCKWCNRLTRENEKLSVRLTGRYKISEQFRKQASRLRKRLQESIFKKKKTVKLRIFNTLGLSEKKKRVAIAREFLIKNTVGSYTADGAIIPWAEREQVFENSIQKALLNSSPLNPTVSPLKIKDVVRKIPEVKKKIQKELDLLKYDRKHDIIEKCQKWVEIRKNFISIDCARNILESSFEASKKDAKRQHFIPKKYTSKSGLVLSDPKVVIDHSTEKKIRKYLQENFNGHLPAVKTCYELIPGRNLH